MLHRHRCICCYLPLTTTTRKHFFVILFEIRKFPATVFRVIFEGGSSLMVKRRLFGALFIWQPLFLSYIHTSNTITCYPFLLSSSVTVTDRYINHAPLHLSSVVLLLFGHSCIDFFIFESDQKRNTLP